MYHFALPGVRQTPDQGRITPQISNPVIMKVAIASGKGGTGKTTLSTNLSAYLAESEKTVLVDLDV